MQNCSVMQDFDSGNQNRFKNDSIFCWSLNSNWNPEYKNGVELGNRLEAESELKSDF